MASLLKSPFFLLSHYIDINSLLKHFLMSFLPYLSALSFAGLNFHQLLYFVSILILSTELLFGSSNLDPARFLKQSPNYIYVSLLSSFDGVDLSVFTCDVKECWVGTGQKPGKEFEEFAAICYDTANDIKEKGGKAAEFVGKAAINIGSTIVETAGTVGDKAVDAASFIGEKAVNLTTEYGPTAKKIAADIGSKTLDAATFIGEKTADFASEYAPKAKTVLTDVLETALNWW